MENWLAVCLEWVLVKSSVYMGNGWLSVMPMMCVLSGCFGNRARNWVIE